MKIINTIRVCINNNLLIATKKMHGLLAASLLTVSMMLVSMGGVYAVEVSDDSEDGIDVAAVDAAVAAAVAALPPNAIKWHPGHYYRISPSSKDNTWAMKQIYSELAATPALRGVQLAYQWRELEKAEGVYDFTSIDARLAELTAQGKRLIVMLHTRMTDPSDPYQSIVPDYVKTSKYEGGEFVISGYGSTVPVGKNTKLWNSEVRLRLVKLFQALGNRYNSHPNFEGIGISESAMGNSLNPITQVQIDNFYANLLIIHQKMSEAFPNTMTFQYVNYPRSIIPSIVNQFKTTGGALGGPDVFLEEPGLFMNKPNKPKGLYTYYPTLSGVIPLSIQVEDPNFENTRYDGTGYQPTIPELLAFARDNLKVNYLFWKRVTGYYPKVLEMLNWRAQTSDPAGGLNSVCPSTYLSCIR